MWLKRFVQAAFSARMSIHMERFPEWCSAGAVHSKWNVWLAYSRPTASGFNLRCLTVSLERFTLPWDLGGLVIQDRATIMPPQPPQTLKMAQKGPKEGPWQYQLRKESEERRNSLM